MNTITTNTTEPREWLRQSDTALGSSSKPKSMKANYWVLACGSDCDGYNRGHVVAFQFKKDAEDYADGQNEWSDGVRYYVTESLDVLRDYCNDYMKDWTKYID